jgi:hypothetical protein
MVGNNVRKPTATSREVPDPNPLEGLKNCLMLAHVDDGERT